MKGDNTHMYNDVIEFHKHYDISAYSDKPTCLPIDTWEARVRFMQEELNEFIYAHARGDLEESFDALLDLVYVALGTAYLMNLPVDEGWQEVHKANMRKVKSININQSKRKMLGDVIKPAGWQPPDLSKILARVSIK